MSPTLLKSLFTRNNHLRCLFIRLFGCTFLLQNLAAEDKNLSIGAMSLQKIRGECCKPGVGSESLEGTAPMHGMAQ